MIRKLCNLLFSALVAVYAISMIYTINRNTANEHPTSSIAMVLDGRGHGTGFFLEDDLLLTNAHVVGSAETVTIQLHTTELVEGEVVGVDHDRDLALVRVSMSVGTVNVLDIGKLKHGQEIRTIGFGGNTWYSEIEGKVSYYFPYIIPDSTENVLYVRASLAVIPGHSGSPVFNSKGNVIGIISRGGNGDALFIPSDSIIEFYENYKIFLNNIRRGN